MVKNIIFLISVFVFLGCSQNMANISINNNSELSKQLLAQKEKSDKEVAKLEAEIAKLEADKEKYREDYETFDNNPILQELDETLKDEEPAQEKKEIQ
jgi:cell division protein FtsB